MELKFTAYDYPELIKRVRAFVEMTADFDVDAKAKVTPATAAKSVVDTVVEDKAHKEKVKQEMDSEPARLQAEVDEPKEQTKVETKSVPETKVETKKAPAKKAAPKKTAEAKADTPTQDKAAIEDHPAHSGEVLDYEKDVRPVLVKAINNLPGGRGIITELLEKYKIGHVSEVPVSEYPAIVADMKERLGEA